MVKPLYQPSCKLYKIHPLINIIHGSDRPWKELKLKCEEIHCNTSTLCAFCHLLGQFGFQKCLYTVITVMQLHQKLIWCVHFLTSSNHVYERSVFWKVLENAIFLVLENSVTNPDYTTYSFFHWERSSSDQLANERTFLPNSFLSSY